MIRVSIDKPVVRLAAALAAILAAASLAPAQERLPAHRVQFERGRTSATVRGNVTLDRHAAYLVGAREGQTLTVHVTSNAKNHDAVFSIEAPSGDPLFEDVTDDWSGTLPESGDYRIDVGLMESDSATFTLEISIR